MKYWLGGAVLTTVASATMPALAQSTTRLTTEVSQRTVEQGQSFQYQITAMAGSGEPMPSSPRLPQPAGTTVHGPSVSSQQHVQISGGTIERRQGFTATWTIVPNRVGKLHVGPASVLVGSKQVQSDAVVIDVVPQGQGPAARSPNRGPFGSDPFDFFNRRGSLFPPGIFDDPFQQNDPLASLPDYPPEYKVTHAPDPIAFVRTRLDKKALVVGEQLTFAAYVYGARGVFDLGGLHEPQTADFVSIRIEEDSAGARVYPIDIDQEIWHAIKVREIALFPLKTGTLQIGSMRVGLKGRGYSSRSGLLERLSPPVTVNVSEPPLAGRPPGYRIGDVGSYELSASVEPRTAEQGDAVAVAVTLKGIGNLPLKLELPQSKGIEWLDPQIRGDVGPQAGVVRGERHFQYVVRVNKAGTIDLGEIRLPYWDPQKNAYFTAKAALGSVQMKASARAASKAEAETEQASSKLHRTLGTRKQLGLAASPPTPLTDLPWFWALLALTPLTVVLGEVTRRTTRNLRKTLDARRTDASSLGQQALQSAEKALQQGRGQEAIAAAERALFHAIEGATGLKGRGILRHELAPKLEEAAVDPATAAELTELLAACESARFTGGDEPDAARQIVGKTRRSVAALTRLGRSRKRARSG
ncbi:MAG TPA: BatD family protein [Polyangiaceae bacterium]